MSVLYEFLIIEVPEAPALAEIIIIENETMNNKNFSNIINTKTVIIKGAQASGGTGLYNSTKGSKIL